MCKRYRALLAPLAAAHVQDTDHLLAAGEVDLQLTGGHQEIGQLTAYPWISREEFGRGHSQPMPSVTNLDLRHPPLTMVVNIDTVAFGPNVASSMLKARER